MRIVPRRSNWSNTMRTTVRTCSSGSRSNPPIGRPDVADRRTHEDFTAGDLVEQPLPHPAAEEVQLGLGHDPREPEQEPVVVVGRVVDAILVGEQGAKQGAELQVG